MKKTKITTEIRAIEKKKIEKMKEIKIAYLKRTN